MPRSRKPPLRRRTAAALLAASLSFVGCKSNEPWTFAVSRSFYGSGGPGKVEVRHDLSCHDGSQGVAVFYLAAFLLPVAIDLVFLPVALTHDLCDRD